MKTVIASAMLAVALFAAVGNAIACKSGHCNHHHHHAHHVAAR
jgi:hypothetical protein